MIKDVSPIHAVSMELVVQFVTAMLTATGVPSVLTVFAKLDAGTMTTAQPIKVVLTTSAQIPVEYRTFAETAPSAK